MIGQIHMPTKITKTQLARLSNTSMMTLTNYIEKNIISPINDGSRFPYFIKEDIQKIYNYRFRNALLLPDSAILIAGSNHNYIDIDGSVYSNYKKVTPSNPLVFKKAYTIVHGYMYIGITYGNRNTNKRVHRLVAEAFIPNPHNLPYVGHIDNNKQNNHVSNLYWTDASENTQKAFNDGLAYNLKGFDDSQSTPVVMFDKKTDTFIKVFGSMRMASKETGCSVSTITRQCKNKKPVRKEFYFRYLKEYPQYNPI